MAIKFNCPKCGKRFTVKDESAGKRGKCSCGAVLEIPSTKVSTLELSGNGVAICAKCLKSIKKGESREIINGQAYCVNCASRDTSAATAEMQEPMSAGDNIQTEGTPLTEEWVRKSFYSRLTGFSIGTLIVTVFLFFKHGKVAAIIGFIVGVIFTIASCGYLLNYDRKLVKKKVTYEEQKAKLRIPKKPQTVAASIAFLLMAFLGLFFAWDKHYNQAKCWDSFGNFMFENMGVKAILLIVNIPVFILIGKWMGGWEFLWRLFKFDLKCSFLPFFIFTKKHWEFYETVNFEKLIQAASIPFICFAVYIVEYIIIKLLFLI
jgi:multisubunit Na+/H+ antiporter MnhB subunit